MNIQNNIEEFLMQTGLFNYNDVPKATTDILPYSKPLQKLNNQIDNLLSESFIQSACNYGLDLKEYLLGLTTNSALPEKNRREKILHTLLTQPDKFNKQGVINSLKSTGIDFVITENFQEESITISPKDKNAIITNSSEIEEAAFKILPAHLDINFNFGEQITWDDFEKSIIN